MRRAWLASIGTVCLSVFLVGGCAHVRYVPPCSEHGGVESKRVTDHEDQFATWDYTCKDGTSQRPEQIEDKNGRYFLAVPSERN